MAAELSISPLVDVFTPSSIMPVQVADDLMSLGRLKGRVVIAPPGKQLVVDGKVIRVADSKDNGDGEPSIDTFFESAANLGENVLAVLLPGGDSKGLDGLSKVQDSGGHVIIHKNDDVIVPEKFNERKPTVMVLGEEEIADTISNYAGGDSFSIEI